MEDGNGIVVDNDNWQTFHLGEVLLISLVGRASQYGCMSLQSAPSPTNLSHPKNGCSAATLENGK